MSDLDNNYWYGRTDRAIVELLGDYIRRERLNQNKTQSWLADAAGINRTTLVEFEKGRNANLLTFIQLLRVLGRIALLENFRPKAEVSPLLLAEMEHGMRRRATGSKKRKRK